MDIDFRKAKELGNRLLTQLDALRDESHLLWSDNHKAWIATGHGIVAEGFRGGVPLSAAARLPRIFSILPEAERHRIPYLMETLPRFLISLDPPEQLRIRKLLLRAFGRSVAEAQRPYAKEIIRDTVDTALNRGAVDFVEEVARPVPGHIILRLMGLGDQYLPKLRGWATALSSGIGGGGATIAAFDACEAALHEMRATFLEELNRRRSDPGDDFLSSLTLPDEQGDRLSDEEALATCYLTITAGHETTTNTLSLGALLLARDPSALELIRTHPESIETASMEIMRLIGMATAMVRTVTRDFDWHGRQLKQGDLVYLVIAAANRDPSVFANPAQLDLARPQTGNMTFAPGLHHCIGHLIAKMQVAEFFQYLAQHCERIEILDQELDWGTSIGFRGLQSWRVRLHKRAKL